MDRDRGRRFGRSRSRSWSPRPRSRSRSPRTRSRSRSPFARRGNGDGFRENKRFSPQNRDRPSKTLMVKGIPFRATRIDVNEFFEKKLGADIVNANLVHDKFTGESKGFAFIEFAAQEDATRVFELANSRSGLRMHSRMLMIDYTLPKENPSNNHHHNRQHHHSKDQQPHGDWICEQCQTINFKRRDECFRCKVPKPVNARLAPSSALDNQNNDCPPCNVLIVRGLPEEADESMIQSAFSYYDPPQAIRLMKDKFTSQSRCFAFVDYDSVERSTAVLTAINKNPGGLRVLQKKVMVGFARGNLDERNAKAANPLAQTAIQAAMSARAMDSNSNTPMVEMDPAKRLVLDESSGYYYDPISRYYFDQYRQCYYDGTSGKFFQWDTSINRFIPHEPEGSEQSSEKKKKKKEKDAKNKAAKQIANDLARWQKQQEKGSKKASIGMVIKKIVRDEPKPDSTPASNTAPPSSEPASQPAPPPNEPMQVEENSESTAPNPASSETSAEPTFDASEVLQVLVPEVATPNTWDLLMDRGMIDIEKGVCFVCRRKLGSLEKLEKHVIGSKLHMENTKKQREEILSALSEEHREEVETLESKTKYRDRAAERRKKYGQPKRVYFPPGHRSRSMSQTVSTGYEQPTVDGLGDNNIGNKMLKAMGWKSGTGLGKNNQGRVDPVQAEMRVQGAGLGSGSTTAVDGKTQTYQDIMKRKARDRFEQLQKDSS